jgi:hypothetical protein
MPFAKITGQGLAAIAFSVALLWGCFIGERLMVHQALAQRTQLMRELHQMQRRNHNSTQPVSAPSPISPHLSRVTLG